MAKGKTLEMLDVLDVAKTQWYHFKVFTVVGIGFFTDAYGLFSFSVVSKILGRLYYTELNPKYPGNLPMNVSFAITSVALCGTLTGQLFFGWLGDKIGRKGVWSYLGHDGFLFLSFRIGGNCPLSAVIMSECANKKTRGTSSQLCLQCKGLGSLCGVVSLIVSAAFESKFNPPSFKENPIRSLTPECDYIWRIILMFAALPAG
uniref:Uncharacterized protein n=1 Tax=Chenopodium quinoa TaxID=63459 RepID=A0A803LS71_CHEQI